MTLSLLSLHDDGLLLIFAHIYGEDALNVSLSSKRLHDLASPRIAAVAECSTFPQLRRLHRYLLSPSHTGVLRALFLERFTIGIEVVEDEDFVDSEVGTEDSEGSRSSDSDVSNSPEHLIGDILTQAKNIKELFLHRFGPCMAEDARIGPAFRSLLRLVDVQLSSIDDSTLTDVLLHANNRNLQRIALAYHSDHDSSYQDQRISPSYYRYTNADGLLDEPHSLTPLLSTLAQFPKLHTVKLYSFTPTEHLSSVSTPALLHSIRHLRLFQSTVCALDIVKLCPNLSTLTFSLDEEGEGPIPSVGSPWRPLRNLRVSSLEDALCVSGRLSTVEKLEVLDEISLAAPQNLPPFESPTACLLGLLRVVSPISLYLFLHAFADDDRMATETLWKEVSNAAPRLRSLEVHLQCCTPSMHHGIDLAWLLDAPRVFRPLPLVCLRIVVPVNGGWVGDRLRIATDETVPAAIPTLRYLSIGDLAPKLLLLNGADVDDEELADVFQFGCGEGRTAGDWDELWRVHGLWAQRWWRIEELGGERVLVAISEDEGKTAQGLIGSPEHLKLVIAKEAHKGHIRLHAINWAMLAAAPCGNDKVP
ncbi:hypothetical protein C8Q80DRAFT_1269144 [Daedaleopsis nitida]|nr:hypothetical protein C8Q80DRAFT_1269144 [Daedaleopsis nitida]